MTLSACTRCSAPVKAHTACPSCGHTASKRGSVAVPMAAALLLGLVACEGNPTETAVALYGVAITDNDGDGYSEDVDCDDNDATRHPDAVETAGDGIDSDCDGADDPGM